MAMKIKVPWEKNKCLQQVQDLSGVNIMLKGNDVMFC